MKQDGRPSMQFYPDKWRTDTGLHLCSLEAQGLWINCLCLMWESPERGTLREANGKQMARILYQANGKQIEAKGLAKILGEDEAAVVRCLEELDSHSVYSTLDDGTIYNRYMYRQWQLSLVRAAAGKAGGLKAKGQAKVPPPSSSSSSTPTPTPKEEAPLTPQSVFEEANSTPKETDPEPMSVLAECQPTQLRRSAHLWRKEIEALEPRFTRSEINAAIRKLPPDSAKHWELGDLLTKPKSKELSDPRTWQGGE